jgi:aspartate/methionine/tyrosine aminotransferase
MSSARLHTVGGLDWVLDPAVRPSIDALQASRIGEVSALGFGQPDVLPLWFGEGDQPTPAFIGAAATAALNAGETFYTYKRGIPQLREAIAAYQTRFFAKPTAAERVVVTNSGMSGIMLVCQALIDPGDNMLVVSPVWPNIVAAIEIMGGEARPVTLAQHDDGSWSLDMERLMEAADRRTKAIFVNSPSNPTGWMMHRPEAEALLAFARRRGLYIISDEVYSRVVYDAPAAPSFLDIIEPEDRVVVVNSFSKAWAMTGWRLGWLTIPAEIGPAIDKLVEFNFSGAPTFLQYGAVAAIRDGEPFVRATAERYHQGRDLIIAGLQRFGRVTVARPEGAFYAFFKVDGMTDSLAFAKEILARARVGLAPGAAFGPGGDGHLRLCFAASAERLNAALDRLAPMLS